MMRTQPFPILTALCLLFSTSTFSQQADTRDHRDDITNFSKKFTYKFTVLESSHPDTIKIIFTDPDNNVRLIRYENTSSLPLLGEETLFTKNEDAAFSTLKQLANGNILYAYLTRVEDRVYDINAMEYTQAGKLVNEKTGFYRINMHEKAHKKTVPNIEVIAPQTGEGFFLIYDDQVPDGFNVMALSNAFTTIWNFMSFNGDYESQGIYTDTAKLESKFYKHSFRPVGNTGLYNFSLNDEFEVEVHEILFNGSEGQYKKHRIKAENHNIYNYGIAVNESSVCIGGIIGAEEKIGGEKTIVTHQLFSLSITEEGIGELETYSIPEHLDDFLPSGESGGVSGYYPFLADISENNELIYEYNGRYYFSKEVAKSMKLKGDMDRFRIDFTLLIDAEGNEKLFYMNRNEFDPSDEKPGRDIFYLEDKNEIAGIYYDMDDETWEKEGGKSVNSFGPEDFDLLYFSFSPAEVEDADEDADNGRVLVNDEILFDHGHEFIPGIGGYFPQATNYEWQYLGNGTFINLEAQHTYFPDPFERFHSQYSLMKIKNM